MRTKIRKPMTTRAKALAVINLDKLRAEGHAPEAVLNQSTLNSWQGLFEIKKTGGQNGQRSFAQEREDRNNAVILAAAERVAQKREIAARERLSQKAGGVLPG
jgi:hypothetical protein